MSDTTDTPTGQSDAPEPEDEETRRILQHEDDQARAAAEADLLRESDNGPRDGEDVVPGDGDTALAP